MADFGAALAQVAEARGKNLEAEGREKGMADDIASALNVIGTTPEDLAGLAEVLDNQLQNALAAQKLADEAYDHVKAADEEGHFEESTNAMQLLEHVKDTAEGQAQVITEAKEALVILLARLDEVKLSLEQVNSASDETVQSTGGAEANLEQLAQRLAG